MNKLKTKIDIVLFIKMVKGLDDKQLHELVKEYRNNEFEVV